MAGIFLASVAAGTVAIRAASVGGSTDDVPISVVITMTLCGCWIGAVVGGALGFVIVATVGVAPTAGDAWGVPPWVAGTGVLASGAGLGFGATALVPLGWAVVERSMPVRPATGWSV